MTAAAGLHRTALPCPDWCTQQHRGEALSRLFPARQHLRVLKSDSDRYPGLKIFVFQYDALRSDGTWQREDAYFELTNPRSHIVKTQQELRATWSLLQVLAPELSGLVREAARLCGLKPPLEATSHG